MFKPNLHLQLSTSQGRWSVDQSLIGLFLETVDRILGDVMLYDGETKLLVVKRRSMRSIGCQLSLYLRWFTLYRLPQDVKPE